jgi:hypothetical protein
VMPKGVEQSGGATHSPLVFRFARSRATAVRKRSSIVSKAKPCCHCRERPFGRPNATGLDR